jgi:hypothetical protein
MEDILHGVRVELTRRSARQGEIFLDRRLVLATAPLLRLPDGSGDCGLADAAFYQARTKVPICF